VYTYIKKAINEGVITRVAHSEAVAAQPHNINVSVPATQTFYMLIDFLFSPRPTADEGFDEIQP